MVRRQHLSAFLVSLSAAACFDAPIVAERELPPLSGASPEDPFEPLPRAIELDGRKVALGARLFREPMLSKRADAACITCHPFDHGGADRTPTSQLPGREPTALNTLSVFNVAFGDRFNWSGYFPTLEAQMDAPMTNPRVMGQSAADSLKRLARSDTYVAAFTDAYHDGLTEPNLRDALATYQRSLITPDAPFDQHLRGDPDALDAKAFEGYRLFKAYGCASCHQGRGVGGNMVQKLGVIRDYFADRGEVRPGDVGLAALTNREEDMFVFRVPSLRNVALTSPYLHDGSAATLEEAVQVMAEYQLGRTLSDDEIASIVAFLGSLTGRIPVEAP